MYDVIVIGAGPAGSTAAKTLAEHGLSVLLVERSKMPRYKSCSGQLIQKSLDLAQKYYGKAVPASVTCTPMENRGMVFTDDAGRVFRFEQPGVNIWRSAFDKWLADEAARSGVEVWDGTAVLACKAEEDGVTVTMKGENICQERASYVINGEGTAGSLKRKLLGRSAPIIATLQTYNEGSIDLAPHYFYAYLQPELSEYDAWFNVKDDQLVLGVSGRDRRGLAHYHAWFLAYMQEHHGLRLDKQLKIDKWLMPCIQPGCPIDYGVGPILFVGEAAGFLNPMGEGISAGMESGHGAAMAMVRQFGHLSGIYEDYRDSVAGLHRYMQRQWSFVGSLASTFREMKI